MLSSITTTHRSQLWRPPAAAQLEPVYDFQFLPASASQHCILNSIQWGVEISSTRWNTVKNT